MKRTYFLTLLVSFFLLNCTKKDEARNEVYIISKKESDYKKILRETRNHATPPPPPRGPFVYGSSTFIIDKDTNVFYFQQPNFFICGKGAENDTVPRLMEFKKEDFIQIPLNSIQDFVTLNYKKGESNFTHIASQIDTLNFKVYFDLANAVAQSTYTRNGDFFIIRKTTQEEDTVIEYKKKEKEYFYRDIKWDTTRIDTNTYKFLRHPK